MVLRVAGIAAVFFAAFMVSKCASSTQPADPALNAAARRVRFVIDQRYVRNCQFLKWLQYRDAVLAEATLPDAREVVKAGGNVMFVPGDPANIGRYAAYRCSDAEFQKIPRLVPSG